MELPVKKENNELFSKENMQNASALLALLHGKSDSICRFFNKEIIVDKAQLKTLNEMIIEKLTLHNVSAITTSMDIVFTSKKILTFKSFEEFLKQDFEIINDVTKSIFVQWDFFVNLNYSVPQRHTVSVRISSTPKPSDIFKVLLNGGFDDVDDISIQSATTLCKVDFVNNTLAEELVNVISTWNDLCESATAKKGRIRHFLFKHKNAISSISKFSAMYCICIIISVLIKLLISYKQLSINSEFLFFSIIIIFPITSLLTSIGKSISQSIYDKCENLLETHIFVLSKGDKKENERIKEKGKCSKEAFWFIVNTLVSIVLSVVFFIIE